MLYKKGWKLETMLTEWRSYGECLLGGTAFGPSLFKVFLKLWILYLPK